jgi:hypothetical protein
MRRKHEIIEGKAISVWDDGEKFADRYTVVYLDDIGESWEGRANVVYLGMSAAPFHPQGFCQHGEMHLDAVAYKGRGGAFNKRIKFDDLPADCQKAVKNDLRGA